MKIINAQNAVPTNEDGLQIYSGKYQNAGANPLTTLITTELRHRFHVAFYAVSDIGYAEIPVYDVQVIPLGFLQGTSPTGGLTFQVNIPVGYTLQYFIVGSIKLSTPIHPELGTPSSDTRVRYSGKWKGIIAAAGTSAVSVLNTTGATFTFTKPTTGEYHIAASSPIFDSSKYNVFMLATLEGLVGSMAVTYSVYIRIVDSSTLHVQVYSNDASTNIAWADAPATIHVSFEIYPK